VTAHGTVLGTTGYMSPEQERGDVDLVDQRTDVFGLGALLRGMTTPMPRRLEAIAARATSADRDQRYSDASAFAEDLRRFQNGDPVSAYREGGLERWNGWYPSTAPRSCWSWSICCFGCFSSSSRTVDSRSLKDSKLGVSKDFGGMRNRLDGQPHLESSSPRDLETSNKG
jgi:hypothetical protein